MLNLHVDCIFDRKCLSFRFVVFHWTPSPAVVAEAMLEIPTESDLGSRDVSALLWTEIRVTPPGPRMPVRGQPQMKVGWLGFPKLNLVVILVAAGGCSQYFRELLFRSRGKLDLENFGEESLNPKQNTKAI